MSWFRRTARRFPRGLLGMIPLILAVEGWLAGREIEFINGTSADWKATRAAIEREAKGREFLCFGDSQLKYGVIPRRIEARTGLRGFNAALGGGHPIASYHLLRRVLASGSRPEVAVVDYIPHTLRIGPHRSEAFWPELLSIREGAEVAWTWRDARFFGAFLARKALASIRHRTKVREALVGRLNGGDADLVKERFAVARMLRNTRENRGALVEPENPAFRGSVETIPAAFTPDRWKADLKTLSYVRGFFNLARANGIRVFWVITPFCPAIESRRSEKGVDELYTRFALQLQAEYPEVTVVDSRKSGYPDDAFHDDIHLSRRGGEALSDDLADLLVQPPDEARIPRFVSLPSFRGRTPDPIVEDTRRSGEMIASGDPAVVRR